MSLIESLYDYQKNIITQFSDRHSFGLFLDMGLGKTILSLAFAEYHECEKVIVITINSKAIESEEVKGSWLNWASKSSMNYKLYKKPFEKDMTFEQDDNSLLLINYESLFSRDKDKLSKLKTSTVLNKVVLNFIKSCKNKNVCIIIDESHKMKDIHSKQTKAIFNIRRQIQAISKDLYIYLLTGTPFTSGYIDRKSVV